MGGPHTKQLQASKIVSEITPIATAELIMDVSSNHPHCFAGVVFYNSASGGTAVLPATGTATITVETQMQPGFFQNVENNAIDVTAAGQVDWSSNTTRVKVNLTSITGATHYQLRVAGNLA